MESETKSAMAEVHPSSYGHALSHNQAANEHIPAHEASEHAVDVINVTQQSPYLEKNFIGTYLAISLGGLSAYGGFVMPATSLALINEDIGTFRSSRCIPNMMLNSRRSFSQHHLGRTCLDLGGNHRLYVCLYYLY